MKKIIIFICTLLLVSCSSSNVDEFEDLISSGYEHKVSLVAVGDNLIHDSIYKSAQIGDEYDFTPIYSDIKSYIQSFDLAFINQETILGGKEIGLSTYPNFNSPQELGDALIDTGFNLFSIANNHTLDRGEKAIVNATTYMDSKDLIYSGARRSPGSHVQVFKKNNINFAFVAYTYGTNGILVPKGKDYLVNLYSHEKASVDINAIKNEVDFIIVSMHWGDEYTLYPNKYQIDAASHLSSLGVDLIIGHHPHVIQPVDEIISNNHKTFVTYSLGNFLSDQKGVDRLIGSALSIEFVKTKRNDNVTLKYNNIEARLLYRYKNLNNFIVMPLTYVGDDILEGYGDYFNSKEQLIKTYYDKIEVR